MDMAVRLLVLFGFCRLCFEINADNWPKGSPVNVVLLARMISRIGLLLGLKVFRNDF